MSDSLEKTAEEILIDRDIREWKRMDTLKGVFEIGYFSAKESQTVDEAWEKSTVKEWYERRRKELLKSVEL